MKQYILVFKRFCTISLLSICALSNAYSDQLISSVDRNQVGQNDTVTLTVRYDGLADSSALGLDALDADFEILSVAPQTNSSTSIDNGRVTKSEYTIWRIILAPKRQGELTIPSLALNGQRSDGIVIQVQDSANVGTPSPLKVIVSADNNQVTPQQQLLVEIEISVADGVSNLNGPQLVVNDADVELLGQFKTQRLENGIARQLLVLRYAVFAKQVGKLTIPIMTYSAVQGGGRRSFFEQDRGKKVIARSAQLVVDVTPADTQISPWFPAQEVVIDSKWSGDISTMKVGEPLTRTVTIIARGQRASLIPPLATQAAVNYKSYKDQPQLNSEPTENGVISTRVESEAIVATVEGALVLPEQRINWWDVNKKEWQVAVLPSETIMVGPGDVGSKTTSTFNNEQALAQFQNQAANPASGNTTLWQLLCGLLVLLSFGQAAYILKLKGYFGKTDRLQPEAQVNLSEKKAWKALQKALKSSDAQSTRDALTIWSKTLSSDQRPMSLSQLANYSDDLDLNEVLKKAFTQLDSCLYNGESTYDVSALVTPLDSLKTWLKQASMRKTSEQKALPPLYK